MQKKDLPQDPSVLDKFTRDLLYVTNEKGEYTTDKSRGWSVKANALDVAWKDIEHRIQDALQQVRDGKASPVLYFMELKLMEPAIVADYTGFWTWTVKRHMKSDVFKKLSEKKLKIYADLFEISLEELLDPIKFLERT